MKPPFSPVTITRESLENHALASLIRDSGDSDMLLSPEALESSLASVMPPDGTPLWVFAYGSLLWNPVFHPIDSVPAILHGYHRRFCFWTMAARGTPDLPGLMLGIERGGICRGQALRVDERVAWDEMRLLWRREMVTGAYVPRRLPIRTAGGPVEAIVFVVNPRHPHYCGNLAEEKVVQHLATATGALGPNRDYLERLWTTLHDLGIPDRRVDRLHGAVRSIVI